MHPCYKVSLQTGTKIIAIVDLVLSIVAFFLGILFLSFGGILTGFGFASYITEANCADEIDHFNFTAGIISKDSISDKEELGIMGVALMIFSNILIIAGAVCILISIVLLIGANKRNRTMCLIWFVHELIYFVLLLTLLIIEISFGGSFGYILIDFVSLTLTGYFLWVVWAFMEEIKGEAAVSPGENP